MVNELLRLIKHKGLNCQAVEGLKPESLEGQTPQEWGSATWAVYNKIKAFLEQQAGRLIEVDTLYPRLVLRERFARTSA